MKQMKTEDRQRKIEKESAEIKKFITQIYAEASLFSFSVFKCIKLMFGLEKDGVLKTDF